MSSIQALIPSSPPGNGPKMPRYLANGLSSSRDGRITVRSPSITNSIRSPATTPRRFLISCGTVSWPLVLIGLVYRFFTCISCGKDTWFYRRSQARSVPLPRVGVYISGHPVLWVKPRITNRHTGRHLQRNHSCPGGEGVVFLVINRRADAYLCRKFFDRDAQHRRGFQFAFVRAARIVPPAWQDVLREHAQGCQLF